MSTVALGYLHDPFARYFVNSLATRRLPVINRGTYTRTTALDNLIDSFLQSTPPTQRKQIISLGAGTDTRYFRLRTEYKNLLYHEFDFPEVCATKRRIIEQNGLGGDSTISDVNIENQKEGQQYSQWSMRPSTSALEGTADSTLDSVYHCHSLDLRLLPSQIEHLPGIESGLPSLIISECCLCYLEVDIARDVIKWFKDRIPNLGIVLYEPIGRDDAFGQMMVDNLATRGVVMPTVQKYKKIGDQIERLAELGFKSQGGEGGSKAETIHDIWETWISREEKERVDGLEGLDEVEEWQLLAKHYVVVWGWTGCHWEGPKLDPRATYYRSRRENASGCVEP